MNYHLAKIKADLLLLLDYSSFIGLNHSTHNQNYVITHKSNKLIYSLGFSLGFYTYTSLVSYTFAFIYCFCCSLEENFLLNLAYMYSLSYCFISSALFYYHSFITLSPAYFISFQ